MPMYTSVAGRLAPSPTGLLHLGNAWAFLLAWLACRKKGGRLVLRLEDIDTQRSRQVYADELMRDLRWLGLDWDEGPDKGGPAAPYRQSGRSALYERALAELSPYLYPCFCTRKELRQLASAPNGTDGQPFYPGTCRSLPVETVELRVGRGEKYALRLRVPGENIEFTDRLFGRQILSPFDYGGDFAVRRSDGLLSYQLCVAVDDSMMGITQVVRGRDLLVSTARQRVVQKYLQTFLGFPPPEEYIHIPLLLDLSGVRLAKRHRSLALATLRERGVSPERIIGFLAHLAGINPGNAPKRPQELVSAFSCEALPVDDLALDVENVLRASTTRHLTALPFEVGA